MRWVAVLGLLAVGACATNPETPSIWQRANGQPLAPGELQTAFNVCQQRTVSHEVHIVVPPGSELWNASTIGSWEIENLPAYQWTSRPEMNTCLYAFGYDQIEAPTTGVGSSTPPSNK